MSPTLSKHSPRVLPARCRTWICSRMMANRNLAKTRYQSRSSTTSPRRVTYLSTTWPDVRKPLKAVRPLVIGLNVCPGSSHDAVLTCGVVRTPEDRAKRGPSQDMAMVPGAPQVRQIGLATAEQLSADRP